jgi:RNA-binding protein
MTTPSKQALKAKAHHLKPVILLGAKGLTEAVILETEVALEAHELIKIKMKGIEKLERQEIADTLCQRLQAELVQLIGAIAIIYRPKKDT